MQACGVTLAIVVVSSVAAAEEVDREFHETFDVREGMRLHLEHGDGEVSLKPWDRDVLDVEVRYHADVTILGFGRKEADFVVDFHEREDEITVIGRETGRGGFHIGINTMRRHEYTYTIRAPSYLELELEGDDGDVRITNWRADIEATLDDGDITLEDIRADRISIQAEDGDVDAHDIEGELFLTSDDGDMRISDCKISWGRFRLEDGDLEIDDCVGDFDIVSDDGYVHMRSIESSELDVRVEDGDIRLELVGGSPDDINLESDDGRINVDLDSTIAVSFSLASDDGRITVDVPDGAVTEERRNFVAGELNGGGGRLRVRSSDGSVKLSVSGSGT